MRGPDRAEGLTIANQEPARLDEPAVFTARQRLDIVHQRTVNSTSREALAFLERSDCASTRRT